MFILLVITFIYKKSLKTITNTGNWYNHVTQNTWQRWHVNVSVLWLLPSTGIWNTPFRCQMTSMDVPNQEMWCMRSVWIHAARPFLDLQPKRSEGPLTYRRNAVGLNATFYSPPIISSSIHCFYFTGSVFITYSIDTASEIIHFVKFLTDQGFEPAVSSVMAPWNLFPNNISQRQWVCFMADRHLWQYSPNNGHH